MDEKMTILLLALSALALCGVIALIILSLRRGGGEKEEIIRLRERTDAFERTVGASLARAREDAARDENRTRDEMNARFEFFAGKLAQMDRDNRAHELEMSKLLADMRDKNALQNERQTRMLSESLDRIRESNEKKLEEMRVTVGEKLDQTLQKRLDASFVAVSKQLESLNKSLGEMKELSTGVTDNVTALNRVLTNVKARGTWAEVQLGGILDQIIPGRYVRNFSPKGTSATVEFAVVIPAADGSRTYMPIDSKFPMEDYARIQQAADAADPAALADARRALRRRILDEAKDVSSKYISVPETTPFAVMYLATEGLYAEVISADDALAERLHSEYNILLTGPSTITALLNSLAMGFRTLAVNEKAEEIRGMLAAVKAQYEKFGGLLEKAHKKVDEAGQALDDAQRRSDLIRKKLGRVDETDADPLMFENE